MDENGIPIYTREVAFAASIQVALHDLDQLVRETALKVCPADRDDPFLYKRLQTGFDQIETDPHTV